LTPNKGLKLPIPVIPVTYVNQSVHQHSRHSCQQIGYTCEDGSLTAPEKCVMAISGSFVYNPCIQLQFLESLLLTNVCYLLPVRIYVTLRRAQPDDATMEDVKKDLSDNGIDFSQLEDWNAYCCRE
jgi:hypothetical protein